MATNIADWNVQTASRTRGRRPREMGNRVIALKRHGGGSRQAGISDSSRSMLAQMVLEELADLLEEFAPMWYSKQHHDRVAAALEMLDS